ncbi:A24 family peptidase [Herbaspirillum sp. RTI4]|uniref:prepilin peptidase n=1 Tax=Herbaspirillum sp. RTI4 TaxID=3048640 RepID=UPI002AB40753|nr:A24 family peptidase [Herbaspirillum sp. RTI4]MDY7577496.1 A24 family peptidase [Herbaspirillum sp. RTI4]MEA9980971.1 A24 family peptidase [Herbaspirillum sp. RTI4]
MSVAMSYYFLAANHTLTQAANPLTTLLAAMLGLLAGSFLNVVIHRLPRMMQRAWENDIAQALGQPLPHTQRYNLVLPRSACPSCSQALRWHNNVPLLSFLRQRGRCHRCDGTISVRYPLIELACALLWAGLIWHFGLTQQGLAALLFATPLLALAAIDHATGLLPDSLTLPLLWLGLLVNLNASFAPLPDAVLGAAIGYTTLWAVYWLFWLATGKEGIGYGDFKLLAALGAWLGWKMLLPVLLFSSVSGAIVGGVLMATGRQAKGTPLPFGPFLALAGLLALLTSPHLLSAYTALFP